MKNATRQDLEQEAAALAAVEVLIETNAGTFGAAECCRKRGCGDPVFGEYQIYESVAGDRHVVGDPDDAPGYARRCGRQELGEKRRQLAELRKQISRM
jgi:hypothetical protein